MKIVKTIGKIFFGILIAIVLLDLLITLFILILNTKMFSNLKSVWIETAMLTDEHKYLATMLFSKEEIEKVLNELEVKNSENSNIGDIIINRFDNSTVKLDKINEATFKAYVITVSNPKKVKLIDTRRENRGSFPKEIFASNLNYVAGINAGGFLDVNGVGRGNTLSTPTIHNSQLIFGDPLAKANYIGLTSKGELVLGRYNYEEAVSHGIVDAVSFSPYIIVNGKEQITNQNSGGIHPRTAIGQKKTGEIIFVVIDGRQINSIGATYMDLQKIFVKYGAYNAANLDGGSSSVMYFNRKIVNTPSGPSGERYLPNMFVVEK